MAAKTEERKKLEKEAKALKVDFTNETTDENLQTLIEGAKEKSTAEKQENKILGEEGKKASEYAKKNPVVLKNTLGEDVAPEDYFFQNITDEMKSKLKPGEEVLPYPVYFNRTCGYPVDREELIEVFHRVFKPKDGFLFYKLRDKELYLVIVPLAKAKTVSSYSESLHGDFQRHAVSFINEGSVNLDALFQKLEKVANHRSISE